DKELHKIAAKKEQKKAKEEARDITVGEFVEMLENPIGSGDSEMHDTLPEEAAVESMAEETEPVAEADEPQAEEAEAGHEEET
ncbi:hypothetical protein LI169_20030, partial [Desulfovibrio desulfuricans]|nr:hypothetical protein [Desulfovibrio desulfuricans]